MNDELCISTIANAKHFDDPTAYDDACCIRFSKRTIKHYLKKDFNADAIVVTDDITLYRSDTAFDIPDVIKIPAGTILCGYKCKLITDDDNVEIIPYIFYDRNVVAHINKKQLAGLTPTTYNLRINIDD